MPDVTYAGLYSGFVHPKTPSTSQLVALAQAGDNASFMQLIDRCAPRSVPAIIAIVRNQHDLEDAIQSAALTAFKNISKIRENAKFESWFLRIAVNEAKSILRKRRNHLDIEAIEFELPAPTSDVDGSLDLWVALEKLPTRNKSIAVLYLSGLNSREISETLDLPSGTVRRILAESYPLLRDLLDHDKEVPHG